MSSQKATQQTSDNMANTASSAYKSTVETVTSAAAGLTGAFSGSLNAGAHASSKQSRTETGDLHKLSKAEADKLYEERMEDEYAKREGGA